MNSSQKYFDKINGLSCNTNRSLTLLAMDSFTYELVAERLGITLKDADQNTAAVIIDSGVSTAQIRKRQILVIEMHSFPSRIPERVGLRT